RDKEANQEARDSDDALVCCIENTIKDRIMDFGASFMLPIAKKSVRNVFLKTSFGTSWTLKDVRYIPSLKRRLISVGQLDEEGYHVCFRDQQWKFTKGSFVEARGNKHGSLYMVKDWYEHVSFQRKLSRCMKGSMNDAPKSIIRSLIVFSMQHTNASSESLASWLASLSLEATGFDYYI
nr:retrovirus-related Pol polyprotein from transposon TNT 1-94 [Tanacetum cinerariifolium]